MVLKHPLLLTLFFTFNVLTEAQEQYDSGLKAMCDHYKGDFTPRESLNAVTGDTCRMEIERVPTSSQRDAEEFCSLYMPYRLIKATYGPKTSCYVEATFICKTNYYFMFGKCYFFDRTNKRRFTYDEAKAYCNTAGSNGQIASLSHRYAPGVWKRYFPKLDQTWIRVTENWLPYVKIDGGQLKKPHEDGEIALAINGFHHDFFVAHKSLVKLDKNTKLRALCEYTPDDTIPEMAYLARRYSEIYYPTIPVSDGLLVRSGSHHTRSKNNLDICREVVKPFKVKDIGSFAPLKEYLDSITKYARDNPESSKQLISVIRTGADIPGAPVFQDSCDNVPNSFPTGNSFYATEVSKQSNLVCDNIRSGGLMHSRNRIWHKAMSDSVSAPVWCKLGKKKTYTPIVPPNYKMFKRANGGVFIHRLEKSGPQQFSKTLDRDIVCQTDARGHPDEHLTGFDSEEEYNFLKKWMEDEGLYAAFVGMQRKPYCENYEYYVEWNMTGMTEEPCSRKNVLEWHHGVASFKPLDKMWHGIEPLSLFRKHLGLQILRSGLFETIWVMGGAYFCGRYASYTEADA